MNRFDKGMDGGGATDFDLSGKDGKYNCIQIQSIDNLIMLAYGAKSLCDPPVVSGRKCFGHNKKAICPKNVCVSISCQ